MIKLVNRDGAVNVGAKMMKGDDGGYYIPAIDAEGTLTFNPSEEGMIPVEPANVRGPAGAKGESGVYIGDTEPTDGSNVWIAPAGEASVSLVTYEQMEEYVAEHGGGSSADLSNYYTKDETNSLIEEIELTPGPQGEKGDPGETPVKGTDYWTEQDKTEIVNEVIAALPVYNGEVI